MSENELFQAALGLLPPWLVDHCTFTVESGRLDLYLDFPRGSSFACPLCAEPAKAYDTESLTWRHLNFFQHQAFLHARTPRVECSRCGIHRIAVPWARSLSEKQRDTPEIGDHSVARISRGASTPPLAASKINPGSPAPAILNEKHPPAGLSKAAWLHGAVECYVSGRPAPTPLLLSLFRVARTAEIPVLA